MADADDATVPPTDPVAPTESVPPADPVLAKRARASELANMGKRLGYSVILIAIVVFAIGVGTEIEPEVLNDIGISGYVLIEDTSALTAALSTIGQRILAQTHRYYLLSYCSPARAGVHEVRVEAHQGELSGSVSYRFDAAGFGPTCDPARPPAFEASSGRLHERTSSRGGAIRIDASVR